MLIKGITDEDFINYKVPSMFICMPYCSFKCDKEYGSKICQNGSVALQPVHDINYKYVVERYIHITSAIVFGGLEPFDSFDELHEFIRYCREGWFDLSKGTHYIAGHLMDDIVIYTGYDASEVSDKLEILRQYPNIIIKWGRYIPDQEPHYDAVLGVYLASDNQYAERIS